MVGLVVPHLKTTTPCARATRSIRIITATNSMEKQSLTLLQRYYLGLLLRYPNGVSTDQFLEWHRGSKRSGSNLVAVHMMGLRRKVRSDWTIETVKGFGYQIFPVKK